MEECTYCIGSNIVDNKIYFEDMGLSVSEHKLYLKLIFKSKVSTILVEENVTILIDFKASLIYKSIIGVLCIIVAFPFFYVNVKAGYYPIIPALLMWFILMFSFIPIAIFGNELIVRKI